MNNRFLFCAATLISATGCSDAIVGSWENDENNSSYEDTLSMASDGTGTRTMEMSKIVEGQSLTLTVEYQVSWEAMTDYEYEAELDCDDASIKAGSQTLESGCNAVANAIKLNGFDFESECTINNDSDVLKCEPEGSDTKIKYERTN